MRQGRLRLLLVAGLASLSTACGSTVAMVSEQQVQTGGAGSDGLTSGSSHSAAPGAGGPLVPSAAGRPAGPGPGSAPPTSAPSSAGGPATAKVPGAVRGPLEVGVVYGETGAANAALGVSTSANGPRVYADALVSALNASGGLAGRRLVPRYYPVDATSADYSTQATAACTYFTEDRPVPVVLDFIFGNSFGMASCLARRGVADFGLGTADTVADNAVGLFAAPTQLTSGRRYTGVLRGLHARGYVTSKNKVGVLLEDCPHLRRAFDREVKPEIVRLGLQLATTEQLGCTSGFSSAGPASAATQSAVLRFRGSGVDRLLMVSDFEQVTLLLIANHAESQGWRPGFMLSSRAQTEVMRPNIASGQWPQLHGMGWAPGLDIDDPRQPLPVVDQRCLDLLKKGGITVSGWQNVYVATTVCANVFFLGAALKATAGNAEGRVLMAAVDRLGGSFVSPGVVAGRTLFGPTRRDGPAAVAPFGYVRSCDCLKYVGAAIPAPR